MKNVYNTNDPEVLLNLKKQEADALRDVIRSINQAHLKPEHIFKITQNTLLAQLAVKKMVFIYQTEEGLEVGINRGFGELPHGLEAQLPKQLSVTAVKDEGHSKLKKMGVEYIVPIQFRRKVGAWFLIADFADSEAERINDLIFIETIGNVLSTAIENRYLINEMLTQEAVRKELDVAERIHQQLLTKEFDLIEGVQIDAINVPHNKIGGDFYDIIPREGRGFFLCIADVAGKGIGAALLMANLQARLRALILSETSLESVIRKLHQSLMRITNGEQFVTFFLAHIRTEEKEIDFINAGHNPPVLIRNNELEFLETGTIPLGILDLPEVKQETISYEAKDMLFLYTDGLVEQVNDEDEMYGETRMERVLKESSKWTPEELIAVFNDEYGTFSEGVEASDDITMLALKFD